MSAVQGLSLCDGILYTECSCGPVPACMREAQLSLVLPRVLFNPAPAQCMLRRCGVVWWGVRASIASVPRVAVWWRSACDVRACTHQLVLLFEDQLRGL
jgi:hypothetical protein